MKSTTDQVKKLGFEGNLNKIIEDVAIKYKLGDIQQTKYLNEGYEDYNIKINATEGNFVLKLFANNQLGDYTKTRRGSDVVERLVEILLAAEKYNLNTPRIRKDKNHEIIYRNYEMVGIVYNWIDGITFYDLDTAPTLSELEIIIEQAAKINKINIQPVYYHDIWAVTHIHALYNKVQSFLSQEDSDLVQKILLRFDNIPLDQLPKSLVHGDFTKGNVIKTSSGKPYIIDFSVSNWTARIIELGLIISNLMYDSRKKTKLEKRVEIATKLYLKHNSLTNQEKKYLYDIALSNTAMEFLGSRWRQEFLDDTSEETKYWLKLGREGMKEALR
ncbi:MAG: hypothetical protein ACD_50C00290G0007 [uncultured bacterium]|nr:MAG: hypothetical protein ACD_50C00290G0007 [uncultured bacterium]OGH13075.1 MAG: hypothetical protein A2687_00235 [Candidatus Levybacteria bacterium RIFCSPHIGHO2_01_FULL_38_26]